MTAFREFAAIVLVECLLPVGFPRQAHAMAGPARTGSSGPLNVFYAQVRELEPKRMSTLAKVGIGAGGTLGILFGVAAAVCAGGACH
jgi:hypothetical protein